MISESISCTTLTPVHIGSGTELQPNFEYLYFKDQSKIAVIDPEKVFSIVGDNNLHFWINKVEKRESLLSFLIKLKSDLKIEDISSIEIKSRGTLDKPIKTLLRSKALGVPLVPGSSIKGAIRTAIFAHLVLGNHRLVKDHEKLGKQNRRGVFVWSDEKLEKIFFGDNPNVDIFRILRIFDYHFEDRTETCIIRSVNKYRDGYRIKDDLTQVVEVIPPGKVATTRLSINDMLTKRGKQVFNDNLQIISQIDRLFDTINKHTLRLVEDEIDYWDYQQNNPECIGDYVDVMKQIKAYVESCSSKECVLRLGWGSGYRFITGDWHGEMTDSDYDSLVRTIRPRHPVEIIFPKTMRLADEGIPLGFVKLSIQ